MRAYLGEHAPHLRTEPGPDRPLRLAAVIVLTVISWALLGVVLGLFLRAWWGPLP